MAASLRLGVHGGRVFELAARLGVAPDDVLDFSASINPLGPPPQAVAAAREALEQIRHYPESDGSGLCRALAEQVGLDGRHILVDAGSTPLIYRVIHLLAPKRALVVEPAFGEYHRALDVAGCRIEPLLVKPGAAFEPDEVARQARKVDLVVLANPGNPSGALILPDRLEGLLDQLPAGTNLLLDEAFIDFCPGRSLVDGVRARSNLWVLRSLTKFYAIPGLRAGWVAGPGEGIERLRRLSWPWVLPTPTLAAARTALRDRDYARRTLEVVPVWRATLAANLGQLGFEVIEGAANYLLARLPEDSPDADTLCSRLAEKAVLVRNCDSFYGLDNRWLRFAVRTPREHARLFAVLDAVLKGSE